MIETILIITGLATCGAFSLVVAPRRMLYVLFRRPDRDPVVFMILRHWGLMICIVGGLLIYAAVDPAIRKPVVIVAILEKAFFVCGVCAIPSTPHAGLLAVEADIAMVFGLLFCLVW